MAEILGMTQLNGRFVTILGKSGGLLSLGDAVFGGALKRSEYLARLKVADLFLDTFPYNGHTTTSDALLAGIPVVSMSGEGFASRVAGSLLHDMKRDDWICSDFASYESKANNQAKINAGKEAISSSEVEWPNDEMMQGKAFSEAIYSL
jgi:predicted O-linked N-acetylglucosamine transferase (SPINDLY family)